MCVYPYKRIGDDPYIAAVKYLNLVRTPPPSPSPGGGASTGGAGGAAPRQSGGGGPPQSGGGSPPQSRGGCPPQSRGGCPPHPRGEHPSRRGRGAGAPAGPPTPGMQPPPGCPPVVGPPPLKVPCYGLGPAAAIAASGNTSAAVAALLANPAFATGFDQVIQAMTPVAASALLGGCGAPIPSRGVAVSQPRPPPLHRASWRRPPPCARLAL